MTLKIRILNTLV